MTQRIPWSRVLAEGAIIHPRASEVRRGSLGVQRAGIWTVLADSWIRAVA